MIGEWEVIANGYETSFLDDDSVLELDCGDSSTTVDILKTIECWVTQLVGWTLRYINYLSKAAKNK